MVKKRFSPYRQSNLKLRRKLYVIKSEIDPIVSGSPLYTIFVIRVIDSWNKTLYIFLVYLQWNSFAKIIRIDLQ